MNSNRRPLISLIFFIKLIETALFIVNIIKNDRLPEPGQIRIKYSLLICFIVNTIFFISYILDLFNLFKNMKKMSIYGFTLSLSVSTLVIVTAVYILFIINDLISKEYFGLLLSINIIDIIIILLICFYLNKRDDYEEL